MAKASKNEEVDPIERDSAPNAVWFKPLMVGFLVLGLVWVMVFYLSDQQYPIPGLAGWNLIIGFGIAFIGFMMTMRWK